MVRSSPFTDRTMIGTFDIARMRRQSSTPSMCGMYKSVITSSGCHSREVGQRGLAFGGGAHLVALAAQHRSEHARNLRLVVHYEHSRFLVVVVGNIIGFLT